MYNISIMSNFTNEEILHLANLAEINLTDKETEQFAKELSVITDAISQLSEVANSDIPRTSHPVANSNVYREDEPVEPMNIEDVAAGAPKSTTTNEVYFNDGFFVSPAILNED
jgi:aspartyl-tRNA(Asn)/glutamyl-tRNA(Gln) amidotransferase subunit C